MNTYTCGLCVYVEKLLSISAFPLSYSALEYRVGHKDLHFFHRNRQRAKNADLSCPALYGYYAVYCMYIIRQKKVRRTFSLFFFSLSFPRFESLGKHFRVQCDDVGLFRRSFDLVITRHAAFTDLLLDDSSKSSCLSIRSEEEARKRPNQSILQHLLYHFHVVLNCCTIKIENEKRHT